MNKIGESTTNQPEDKKTDNIKQPTTNQPDNNKIDNAEHVNQAQPAEADSNTSENQGNGTENSSELSKENNKTTRKHSITYLAGGIWKDARGKFWCREEKKNCVTAETFTDTELNDRPDIQYMIKYGAMRDVIVE